MCLDFYVLSIHVKGKMQNRFNGKENDDEMYGDDNEQDYGMRIYDPRLGRFLSVDPIARQYPELTPYQFASNSPISGVDLDGLEYFFAANGTFLGKIGNDTKVRVAKSDQISNVKKYIEWTNTSVSEQYKQYNYDQVITGSNALNTDYGTLKSIAVTAYSESGYAPDAIMGIANTVVNRHNLYKSSGKSKYAGSSWTLQNTLVKIRNNWSDEQYKGHNPAAKNFFNTKIEDMAKNSLMLKGFEAAINAISGGKDYSDGAMGWHGVDILSNENWMENIDYGIDFSTNSSKVEIGLFKNANLRNKVSVPMFIAIKTIEGQRGLDKPKGTAATLFYKPSNAAYQKAGWGKTGGL